MSRPGRKKGEILIESILHTLSEHSLLILLSLGTLASFGWLRYCHNRLPVPWFVALALAVGHTLIGVASVKVFAVLEYADLSRAGNMSLFGGVFFMPICYLLGAKLARRKTADVCDVFTGCMILTVACARVNCILSGCCTGRVIPGLALRYPTRELELVFYLILLLILSPRVKRGEGRGTAYPLYMVSYGAVRFLLECFRTANSPLGMIHLGHIWAVLSFLIGLSIYFTQLENVKRKKR